MKGVYWLTDHEALFGKEAMYLTHPVENLDAFRQGAFLLYSLQGTSLYLLFVVPVLIIAGAGLFKIRSSLSDLLLWFLVLNIHNAVYSSLSGGEVLLNQLLFFNTFLSFGKHFRHSGLRTLQVSIHNFGVAAVMLQVCIVYFFSALTKLADSMWMNGEALGLIFRVEHYSNSYFSEMAMASPGTVSFLNYFVILYQASFPLLIWLKVIKRPMIIAGIIIHTGIAIGMGIITFSMIMMIPYVYFWPEKATEQKFS